MSSSGDLYLSMALAYLEIGKNAALGESELKHTDVYDNAVAYQGACKSNCVTAHASVPCKGGYHEQHNERQRPGTA